MRCLEAAATDIAHTAFNSTQAPLPIPSEATACDEMCSCAQALIFFVFEGVKILNLYNISFFSHAI